MCDGADELREIEHPDCGVVDEGGIAAGALNLAPQHAEQQEGAADFRVRAGDELVDDVVQQALGKHRPDGVGAGAEPGEGILRCLDDLRDVPLNRTGLGTQLRDRLRRVDEIERNAGQRVREVAPGGGRGSQFIRNGTLRIGDAEIGEQLLQRCRNVGRRREATPEQDAGIAHVLDDRHQRALAISGHERNPCSASSTRARQVAGPARPGAVLR